MTLYQTPEAVLTYLPGTETLWLSYSATNVSAAFQLAFEQTVAVMRSQKVGKLVLDLKDSASLPSDDEQNVLDPIVRKLPIEFDQPTFIAAVLSVQQYQSQVGSYSPASAQLVPLGPVEFNYFTSRRDAIAWLSDN
ncbi:MULTISPECIES: hypothetical protein [Hymenobacter]|uniref:STAS/SEC14 domain-containing protein n=1 Tax=Hymenobacter jejuensis TaxID=2502781 RepID=A0A5B7ZY12_9BACT|nr:MULTISPECIES: hypothetical protein [Hymenobacter]MBC6991761.1 hypothetical protein [Hymenobacter sp. BT491]QDA60081.1 hypothetical protein FHG12_08155 [Hymenobacter jejuensis]